MENLAYFLLGFSTSALFFEVTIARKNQQLFERALDFIVKVDAHLDKRKGKTHEKESKTCC